MKPEGKGGCMNWKQLMACTCLLGTFLNLYSDIESELPGYQNTIVEIGEFDTPTSYKIVMTFEQPHPICIYTPQNFEESCDDTVYRAFMPRTTIAPEVTTELDLDATSEGVELLLSGTSVRKFMGEDHVMFVVKK